MPVSRNAHQTQLPDTPFKRTMSVTKLGVSVEKVVATIETPRSHQGIERPERKNWDVDRPACRAAQKPMARTAEGRSFLGTVGDGFRFAAGDGIIGPVLLLVTLLGFGVRPYVELLPGFADQVFAKGVGGLAGLASAVGLGAVAGGLAIAGRSSPSVLLRGVMIPPALASICVLLFAAGPSYPVALLCAALAGTFVSIGSISAQTLIQLAVAEHMRGRILSLYGLLFRSAPAVGALSMGVLADSIGLRPPLALGASLSGMAIVLVWRQWGRVETRIEGLGL